MKYEVSCGTTVTSTTPFSYLPFRTPFIFDRKIYIKISSDEAVRVRKANGESCFELIQFTPSAAVEPYTSTLRLEWTP